MLCTSLQQQIKFAQIPKQTLILEGYVQISKMLPLYYFFFHFFFPNHISYLSTEFHIPGMRHTDHMIDISQRELENGIGEDGACISKSKEGVVGENCLESHRLGMKHGLMGHCRKRLIKK